MIAGTATVMGEVVVGVVGPGVGIETGTVAETEIGAGIVGTDRVHIIHGRCQAMVGIRPMA